MKAVLGYMAYCVAAVLMMSVAGCSMNERLSLTDDVVQEGIPVRVSLAYGAQENVVETRAAQSEDYENRIENLYLFVFNSAGQRQPLLLNTDGEERADNVFRFKGGLNPDESNVSLGSGTVEFVCSSLNDATIVAIANVTDGTTGTAYTVTPGELDAIQTLSELRSKIMTMNTDAISRGALFMMTGYAETTDEEGNPTGDTKIDISGSESGTAVLQCALMLRRTDAKIEVCLRAEAADEKWTDFVFVPGTWRVHKVPRQSLILPDTTPKDAEGEYFSTNATEFETSTKGVHGFVFYMPENLKTPEKRISVNDSPTEEEKATAYALREKWITEDYDNPAKPGQSKRNVKFEYADENSTYLEITGELSYNKADGSPVQATTRYYIHLGYADEDPNDYLTQRNHHYTYNITVKGVDKIILEVTHGSDLRPGHEGDVIASKHSIYELDSHYDRCTVDIAPADIVAEGETQTTWSVSTPFCDGGVYDPVSGSFSGVEDYRWIKFAINELHGAGYGEFVKYPGDQSYNSAFVPDENTAAEDLPGLLDVNQLVAYLKIHKQREPDMTSLIPDDSDGLICITAFVDEYVYVDDPRTPEEEYDLKLWTKFVNAADREMHILSKGRSYSADGNSSYIPSLYSFRQKSIRTMYNTDPSVATTAWGLESVMETDRLPVGSIPASASDAQNGRANMLEWIGNRKWSWTQVLSTSDRYELNTGFKDALYACVMRNRDLNGDDIIDAEEIRWYLASINQLTDMYIGEYAIDNESRLYPWDPASGIYPDNGEENSVYWHYTSSTAAGEGKPMVLWAEEGAGKGEYKTKEEDIDGTESKNGVNYAYRCVRNLGIDIGSAAVAPEDFVKWEQNGDYSWLFDLSKLSSQALRKYYVEGAGTYPANDEKDEDNLPYVRFEVSGKLYLEPDRTWEGGLFDGEYVWNERDWNWFQTNNPCNGDGYRVPNMRELLIFMSRIGGDLSDRWLDMYDGWTYNFYQPHILSNTSFSMKDISPYDDDNPRRQGYSYNSKENSMGPGANTGYTCGVKDVIR